MPRPPDLRQIIEGFDARASSYAKNDWHRRCAERLVSLCRLQPGDRVLDAGTGTGFAAMAAARAVGSDGHVLGIDVSPGMLSVARAARDADNLRHLEFREADATQLPDLPDGTFDVVTCAAALLYMPVSTALREWHRVLTQGGRVAFSTMCAGSPLAGRIYRECALTFGVSLRDPSAALGSAEASQKALEAAGFEVIDTISETIEFTAQDLTLAWESNFRSAGHAEAQRLSADALAGFKQAYLNALTREDTERPGSLNRADLLYVVGRRP